MENPSTIEGIAVSCEAAGAHGWLDDGFEEIVRTVINPSRKSRNTATYSHCCLSFDKRRRKDHKDDADNYGGHLQSINISSIFRSGHHDLTKEEAAADFKDWLQTQGLAISKQGQLAIGVRHRAGAETTRNLIDTGSDKMEMHHYQRDVAIQAASALGIDCRDNPDGCRCKYKARWKDANEQRSTALIRNSLLTETNLELQRERQSLQFSLQESHSRQAALQQQLQTVQSQLDQLTCTVRRLAMREAEMKSMISSQNNKITGLQSLVADKGSYLGKRVPSFDAAPLGHDDGSSRAALVKKLGQIITRYNN